MAARKRTARCPSVAALSSDPYLWTALSCSPLLLQGQDLSVVSVVSDGHLAGRRGVHVILGPEAHCGMHSGYRRNAYAGQFRCDAFEPCRCLLHTPEDFMGGMTDARTMMNSEH
jgi:hypothetical protein